MNIDGLSSSSLFLLFGRRADALGAAEKLAALVSSTAKGGPAQAIAVPEQAPKVRIERDPETGRLTGYGEGWSSNFTEDEARDSAAYMAPRLRGLLEGDLRQMEYWVSVTYEEQFAYFLERGKDPGMSRERFEEVRVQSYESARGRLQRFGLRGGELTVGDDGTRSIAAYEMKVQTSSRAYTGRTFGVMFVATGGNGASYSITTQPLGAVITGGWYEVVA
jgi:hypothetical protein